MIKLKKLPYVLTAFFAASAMCAVTAVNTGVYDMSSSEDVVMYVMSYICAVLFGGLIAVKINLKEKIYRTVSWVIFSLAPFFCMTVSMTLTETWGYSIGIYLINLMFYVSVMGIIFALSRNMRLTSAITVLIAYLFNLASVAVNILRGVPFVPGDIIAIGTAAQVAGHYTFVLCGSMVTGTALAAFFIALAVKFSYKLKFRYRNVIIPSCGIAAALVFALSLSFADYSDMNFSDQHYANKTYGTAYSFYVNTRNLMLKKPEGYSEDEVKKFLEEDDVYTAENMPNIIAVMNESFADLSAEGEFETNKEYMPFFNSLSDNAVRGQLLVSPFGGYTCNTEFEFLTGLSMGLLPSGSTPYLQYVQKPYDFALPSHLSKLGYKTAAVHPYYGACWNRQKVYDMFGFDEFISIENLSDVLGESEWKYVRSYLSDETSYDAVMNCLEKKNDDERMFIFNVTVQNHGGYTYENCDIDKVTVNGREGFYKETEQYLSLIRESDRALGEFTERLKSYDEPTVVIFFGDHQPAVEQGFFEELYGKPLESLSYDELQKRYIVPFVIWANYDIESAQGVKTSPNYLSNLALDIAGIPKSRLGQLTSRISNQIPQINGMGYYDSYGKWHERNAEKPEIMRQYESIGYYMASGE